MGLHNRGAAEGRLDGATTYRADVFSWTNDVAAPSGQVAGSIVCNGNLHHSVKQLKGFACNSLGSVAVTMVPGEGSGPNVCPFALSGGQAAAEHSEQVPRTARDVHTPSPNAAQTSAGQ